MKKRKSIRVSPKTWAKLKELKIAFNMNSIDDVIKELIKRTTE